MYIYIIPPYLGNRLHMQHCGYGTLNMGAVPIPGQAALVALFLARGKNTIEVYQVLQ
jgi:hypothetical protein